MITMHKHILPILFLYLIIPELCLSQKLKTTALDTIYQSVKWRNIGPHRGGRSVCASGVIGDPLTYYMGTTGGGLWKTTDAGQQWSNISDGFFKTGSVGAVAVSESHTNIVYVGMGEHAPRAVMTSHGDGVYKSNDAGKTWVHLGLEKTQHISRIIVHPKNPDIVYVAAQGALYGKNNERGVYKTIDGGKSWKKVLFVDAGTGCSELSIDHSNPLVLYAAMWEHQRVPWKVISGGPGSGLYKSVDGGETWSTIHKGLPKEKGKMAIAVSRANSNKVFALIESDSKKEKGGLFVSNNAGNSWTKISSDHRLIQRSWYYIEVFPDPNNEEVLYVLSAPCLRSKDGGKTWERISGTHGDYHDLWINPNNSKNMVIANDGGAAISFNYGKSWSTQANMPTAQFYRVAVDNLFPYNIYGGQQDNSSVKIANREFGSGGISKNSWTYSAGGESAFLAFDPDNPELVMGGSYLGTIELLDYKAKASTNIMSAPIQYLGEEARNMKYLFNWNAPIIRSKHEENTFYHAAQYLLKTKDLGQSWVEVSPDLTRNIDEKQGNGGGPYTNEAVGAENYGTISYVQESPHEAGVIYTGSDDGLIYITKDNCQNWTNITPKNLDECLINAIEVSPHDPATVYIATTRYKFDDKTPAIYKSSNYGKSWKNISKGIPHGAYTRVIREDEKRKDLLFVGTETGIYISFDGGQKWTPFQLNMPITPILDIVIKHDDIVVASSGRSFWVFDDLGLIRQQSEDLDSFHLFKPEDTYIANAWSELDGNNPKFSGSHPFRGVNPATGMVIYYTLPRLPDSVEVTLTILDSDGLVVNTLSSKKDKTYRKWEGGPPPSPVLTKKAGLNRFVWNTRTKYMPGIPDVYIEASFMGHKVGPGDYTLKMSYDDKEIELQAKLLANPLYPSDLDYDSYDTFMSEMEQNLTDMHHMTNSLFKKQNQIKKLLEQIKNKPNADTVLNQGKKLLKSMKEWDNDMVQRLNKAYDDVENHPNKFTANYLYLINQTESTLPRVNQGSIDRRKELDKRWHQLKAKGQDLFNNHLPTFNQLLWKHGIGGIWLE